MLLSQRPIAGTEAITVVLATAQQQAECLTFFGGCSSQPLEQAIKLDVAFKVPWQQACP